MSYDWSGKSVFVTGASSGLGEGFVKEVGKRGANVTLLARREKRLKSIADEFTRWEGESLVLPADVTDQEAVEKSIDETVDRFGQLDLVLANAGVSWATPADEFDLEDFKKTLEINLNGVIHTIIPAIDHMKSQGRGRIGIVSSIASFFGLPEKAPYCASKAALARFAESIRIDLSDHNISVTTIYPGYVKTPMTDKYPEDEMSFLVERDDAVRKIRKALEKGSTSSAFPWQMALLTSLERFLPLSLIEYLVPKMAAPMNDDAT